MNDFPSSLKGNSSRYNSVTFLTIQNSFFSCFPLTDCPLFRTNVKGIRTF
jgi:hypothetical protein